MRSKRDLDNEIEMVKIELTRINCVEVEKKNEERKSVEETAPPEWRWKRGLRCVFFLVQRKGELGVFYDFVLVNDMLFIFHPLKVKRVCAGGSFF